MAGVFEKLLSIARRPVPDPAAVPEKAGRKPARDALPATEDELAAAIALATQERIAAVQSINTAGARREELLMEPGSDEEIALIGREVDAAQLMLERLDRLEPELTYRLSLLIDQKRIARWAELRDAYVQAGVAHMVALRAIHLDYGAYARAHNAITAEFPDAIDLIPAFYFPAASDEADRLGRALDQFYLTQFSPRPVRVPLATVSLADIATHGTPEEIEAARAVWGDIPDVSKKRVRFRHATNIEGVWHGENSEALLLEWTADFEIASGRAVLVENERETV